MKKLLLFTIFIICLLAVKAQPGRYYMNDQAMQPWGSVTNINAMNQAFGVGNWTQTYFQTVNVNALLQPSVCFIYMDGSATNANALNNFLTMNSVALQTWVFNGGKLFLNASPLQGGNISFGFGGNTCVYPAGISNTGTASVGQAGHQIFNFPFNPAGTAYVGNPYATAYLTTSNATAVITGTAGTVLNELIWGSGRIMFGSMSTTNWQNPAPNAGNLRANILVYLAGFGTTSSASNPTVLCAGQSATLTASGLQPGATYSWIPINQAGTTVVVTPTATTSYTVIGTPTLGCYSQSAISITVNPLPTVTVNSGSICSGNSFTIIPSGANSYTITGGLAIVSPTVTSSYSVSGTSTAGCISATPAVSNITVSVLPLPTITVNSGSICMGNSFTMAPGGANTYTFQGGNAIVSPTTNTNYTVTGTSTAGCISQSFATSSITVIALPTIAAVSSSSLICTGETATLTGSGALNYTWNPGTGGTSISVSPTINTSYTLTGTDANGCTNSFVLIQNVDPCTSIVSVSNSAREFQIFPNPNSGTFKLKTDQIENGDLILINSLGQKVFEQKINLGENEIITKGLSAGLFHYIILQDKQQVSKGKIIIE